MAKFFLFIVVSVLNFYFISCNKAAIPANYTLSELRDIEKKFDNCKKDKDCEFGSLSIYLNDENPGAEFLCLDNDTKSCLYVNTTMYMTNNEIYHSPYKYSLSSDEKKPILKTCDKSQVISNECSTDKCSADSDCFSGSCFSNNCITGNATVYLCEATNGNGYKSFYCGKQGQMKCSNDDECFSHQCTDGFCRNALSDAAVDWDHIVLSFLLYSALAIIVIIFLIVALCKCYRKKHSSKC